MQVKRELIVTLCRDARGLFVNLHQELEGIMAHALEDFGVVKSFLGHYYEKKEVLSDPEENEKHINEIVKNLQYIDILQQRFSHIVGVDKKMIGEIDKVIDGHEKGMVYLLAFNYLNQLNSFQFEAAIKNYLKSTRSIKGHINNFYEMHLYEFRKFEKPGDFFRHNHVISVKLVEVYNFFYHQLNEMFAPLWSPDMEEVKKTLLSLQGLYTMEAERKLMDNYIQTLEDATVKMEGHDGILDHDHHIELF